MVQQSNHRCWVEVDLDALRHNVSALRRLAPGRKLLAVVKADAYGHGLSRVAGALMQSGVDGFAVANLSEGLVLRRRGGPDRPILLFGSALPFEIPAIVEHRLTPTLSTLEEARQFSAEAARQNRTVAVQAEIDTGMGRVGFWHEDAVPDLAAVARLPNLQLEALYTHFPSADENLEETRRELELFLGVAHRLEARGVRVPIKHAANSAALVSLPEAHLDLVRPGLLLYGVCPVDGPVSREFRPVLAFKSRVALVRTVAAGRSISYGKTFVSKAAMSVATVAAGYGDGFSRHLSNCGQVLVGGQRRPVVGRVTMDQLMVDVTGLPAVPPGAEVVFIGRQAAAEITAGEVARWAGTIAWEILCATNQPGRVPRIYHGGAVA